MVPACRTGGEGFAIPTFDLVPNDVEGFMEELWEFQSAFHDCFARSEPRAYFFDYMGSGPILVMSGEAWYIPHLYPEETRTAIP